MDAHSPGVAPSCRRGRLLACLLFRPQYEAEAWLQIDEKPSYLAFESRSEERAQTFVSTQVELLRSPVVLGRAVRSESISPISQAEGQQQAVRWLARQLNVKPIGQSELCRVALSMPDPERAAQLVNAVVDAYFALRAQEENDRSELMVRLLEEERERHAMEVATLREGLRGRTGSASVPGPSEGAAHGETAAAHALAEIQGRLVTAEVEREMLKARIKAAEALDSATSPHTPEIDKAVEEDAEVRKLKSAVTEKREQLQEIESRVSARIPGPHVPGTEYTSCEG